MRLVERMMEWGDGDGQVLFYWRGLLPNHSSPLICIVMREPPNQEGLLWMDLSIEWWL
jgi:hypothetical protein